MKNGAYFRLNYNYKEKYLLTATVRYDGSSRLADGNKWHAFPSVALGWNLMRENFMQNVNADVLSGMKLRLSWGNVGSTAISAYQTMSRLQVLVRDKRCDGCSSGFCAG